MKKPTVRDVAKRANVSVATVSRIINGLGKYSTETEQRVKKIMKEMGFEPNAVARNLSVQSSKIIGLLLPTIETGVYDDVLKGIQKRATDYGYSVIICYTGVGGQNTLNYVKVLLANQVAGIIYGTAELFQECYELIKASNIPCVLALTLVEDLKIPYVKVNDRKAAYDAVTYLIQKGHTKIAHITEYATSPTVKWLRLEGYLQALKDHHIAVDENLIIRAEVTYEGGMKAMGTLLDRAIDFSAVFAYCDEIAIGAMNEAHKRGIRIPDQLSFMGYDNTKSSQISYPALTTLSQPLIAVGEVSVEKLISRIDTGMDSDSCFLQHDIVERESVKQIK
jgi:LacI family transcriptional regulator